MKIDWPDKVEAEAPETTEMPKDTMSGGAHANH
jgi:hypothetical protein